MISVVFYCYMINDWKERLSRQIKRLYYSGLYDAAESLFLFATDTTNNLENEIKELIKDFPKIQLDYTNINYAESFALSKIDDLTRDNNEERKILYFHTKGVFNKYKNFDTQEIDEIKVRGINCWCDMMEHCLIDNWAFCVEKLEENDIVGTFCKNYWWWGNFWWTKSSHVRKIPKMKDFYNGSRWSVEAWIFESAPDKDSVVYHECNPIKYDSCYSEVPKYFYNKEIDLSNISINILEAKYGYFAQQRDEGRCVPPYEERTIDITNKIKNIIENNPRQIINPEEFAEGDLAPGYEKALRIKFSTNIDPEKEYIITSLCHDHFTIVS